MTPPKMQLAVVVAGSWILQALLLVFLLLATTGVTTTTAAPNVARHHTSRTLQQSLVILEDTTWDKPGDDDVLLTPGEGITVFSNVTLTIRGKSPQQPIRIVFNYSSYYYEDNGPPPKISLYPNATLILEYVELRNLQTTATNILFGNPTVLLWMISSTVRMDHVHCSNMNNCVASNSRSDTTKTRPPKLYVTNSIFQNN